MEGHVPRCHYCLRSDVSLRSAKSAVSGPILVCDTCGREHGYPPSPSSQSHDPVAPAYGGAKSVREIDAENHMAASSSPNAPPSALATTRAGMCGVDQAGAWPAPSRRVGGRKGDERMTTQRDQSESLTAAIEAAPGGTWGLVIEPWTPGEVYGVAAIWGEAAAMVYHYTGDGEWEPMGRQVADFRHQPEAALMEELQESISMSGGEPEEARELVADATPF